MNPRFVFLVCYLLWEYGLFLNDLQALVTIILFFLAAFLVTRDYRHWRVWR